MEPRWLSGGCHCGAVRFKVRVHEPRALACNCSICAKKGMVNLIASAEDFVLEQGADVLSTYKFNTQLAEHKFCSTCGIHPFSRPRPHADGYDINARCLDDGYDFLEVSEFDGQNWEASVESIR